MFRARFVLLVLFVFVSNVFADVEVKKWEPFEVRFIAENKYENPYLEAMPHNGEALLRVTFTGISGESEGMSYTLEGFWDGNWEDRRRDVVRNTFRVRFAPPACGVWQYESFSKDKKMNGVTGKIRVTDWTEEEKIENPSRRGHIQVCKKGSRASRYFEYADGTPFLWIADIWSYWTKKGVHFSSFQDVVEDRVEKGFTVGMMRFSSNRRGVPLDNTCDNLDINEMKKIDGMAAYANSQGLTIWVLHWWGGEYIKEVGVEKMRRFCRYLVSRLGAYNVVWVVAGEYNLYNYGGLGIDFWKEYGAYVKSIDPYQKRVVSIHHTPPTWSGGEEAPQWSTGELLSNEKWMDYNQFQVGHGDWRNEKIPEIAKFNYSLKPVKPVICTEPWIEFLKHTTPASQVRFGGWSSILSGAAGHTYGAGGVWFAQVQEKPASPFSYDIDWYHKALDYPGGTGIGIMSRFFQSIEWWELEPHQDLISDTNNIFCSAVPGEKYVIYLRNGGSVTVNLTASSKGDMFNYRWFNPRTGLYHSSGDIPGGGEKGFTAPDGNEWVLYLVSSRK
ncbi:DUF4038 domain-containing protein [bacterium]|nr:DUF4038 domain-containing protein [bacterium]